MKRSTWLQRSAYAGALFALLAGVPLVLAAPASAAVPVASACNSGWYVNDDETKLAPTQVPTGFLFDGPSIVHRLLPTPLLLAQVPGNGSFTASVKVGSVPPLFKMETSGPYSTINKTDTGKYWSSKIPSGLGSQAMPVDSVGMFAALAPYSATTTVYSFGVGYANDVGNQAIVKSVTFGPVTRSLACVVPSASASVSASASATPTVSASNASPAPVGNSLPLTGSPVRIMALLGAAGVAAGVALYFLAKRRRPRFEA